MLLEVDLDYPIQFHNLHKDYPLAPESFTVQEQMLSPTQKYMRQTIKQQYGSVQKIKPKLIPNLYNKKNYIVHSSVLVFYLDHGLKLT